MDHDLRHFHAGADSVDDLMPPPPAPRQAWMLTFADLVSLMLTFFVMLFAMSSVQIDKWEQIADALSKTMEPAPNPNAQPGPAARYNIGTVFRRKAIDLDYLEGVLLDVTAETPQLNDAKVQVLDDRLVISLPGDILFQPRSAVMSKAASGAVVALGGYLRNLSNQIEVVGHTSPSDPGGSYTSNWELSIGRAASVANALKDAGYSDDIFVSGVADTRFKELADLPERERMRIANRVDIAILSAKKGQ